MLVMLLAFTGCAITGGAADGKVVLGEFVQPVGRITIADCSRVGVRAAHQSYGAVSIKAGHCPSCSTAGLA